jgi:hypothetical protein
MMRSLGEGGMDLMRSRARDMAKLDTKANPCFASMGIYIKVDIKTSFPQLMKLVDKTV